MLTGFGLAVEIGDWQRFTGATIGAWLGLVPSEQSSGGRRSQGSITKTGNTHARRLLVEAAWHHRNPIGPASSSEPATPASPPRSENAPTAATTDSTSVGVGWMLEPSAPPSAWSRSPRACRMVLEPGRPGGLTDTSAGRWAAQRESDPRHTYEQPGRSTGWVTLDL